jgi:DNA repair photolyase
MAVIEIQAKSLLRKHPRLDTWFMSRYGMNLYRGCAHGCLYCDGRDERYRVEGEFGCDVTVKVNAPDLLRRELDPARRRKPLRPGIVLLGGGVGDAYQPLEVKYGLATRCLEALAGSGFGVHVLTKSSLVERDIDLLKRIDGRARAIVSFSLSTADDTLGRAFEPGASPPSERLAAMKRIDRRGIAVGMALLPAIPFVTDLPALIEETVARAREAGAQFVLYGGMTLKRGRQMDFFMKGLSSLYPSLSHNYAILYRGDQWGRPAAEYERMLDEIAGAALRRHGLPPRIPPRLFADVLDPTDRVVAMLEHCHWRLTSRGYSSPYGHAAWRISQLDRPLESMRQELRQIRGVGPAIESMIKEILDSGSSRRYDRIMRMEGGVGMD